MPWSQLTPSKSEWSSPGKSSAASADLAGDSSPAKSITESDLFGPSVLTPPPKRDQALGLVNLSVSGKAGDAGEAAEDPKTPMAKTESEKRAELAEKIL